MAEERSVKEQLTAVDGSGLERERRKAQKQAARAEVQKFRHDRAVYLLAEQGAIDLFARCVAVFAEMGRLWAVPRSNEAESVIVAEAQALVKKAKAMATHVVREDKAMATHVVREDKAMAKPVIEEAKATATHEGRETSSLSEDAYGECYLLVYEENEESIEPYIGTVKVEAGFLYPNAFGYLNRFPVGTLIYRLPSREIHPFGILPSD